MNIENYRIILASKSPRRRELLSEITENFEVVTADVDESLNGIDPKIGVEILAKRKGLAVAELFKGEKVSPIIISSDTLVEQNNIPMGKPKDKEDAKKMLLKLSGKSHNVHTGVAVHYKGRVFSGVSSTEVVFKNLTEKEICDYIETGEPMDKAGAYGIQGKGGQFVKEYRGEFDTVVGLSLKLTWNLIEEALSSFGEVE